MRVTTVLRRLLGVTDLFVQFVSFEVEGLVVRVRPRWRHPRCNECGRRSACYDHRPARRWRHLGLGSVKLWLEYAPRRVACSRCGTVRVEKLPWAEPASRFTRDFEETVAYLAQVCDQTQVTKLMGIAWVTVGSIVERVVARRLDPSRLDDLVRIGVDEFSYRKRHNYMTIVVDHDKRRVVWAGKGREAATLEGFFEELGPERIRKIESITIDMARGFIKAIAAHAPHAKVIFDRFHVQRLAGDAVDEVRRVLLRDLRGSEEGKQLFRSRFALLKNPWNLTPKEEQKLASIQETNKPLYRAYLLKESLARALDYKQPWRARRALREWLAWASRSRLKPFVRVAATIRQHFAGVLAYVEERLTNGLVEGLNNHIRVIARRAYGFHSAEALIAMVFLCCGGIRLDPPLPGPTGC